MSDGRETERSAAAATRHRRGAARCAGGAGADRAQRGREFAAACADSQWELSLIGHNAVDGLTMNTSMEINSARMFPWEFPK